VCFYCDGVFILIGIERKYNKTVTCESVFYFNIEMKCERANEKLMKN